MNAKIPPELVTTVEMLRRAYGEAVPEADYMALLLVLSDFMSDRQLATTLTFVTDREHVVIWNDIAAAMSVSPPSAEAVDRVRQRLAGAGFEAWSKEEQ
jgi:hypothetical protein